jgi:hypothetical protein
MRTRHTTLAAGLLAILAVAAPSQAQQFTAATPFHTLHDSFFENQSITWAGNYRGVNFSFGSAALSTPQFGTPNNSAGLTTNFGYFNKYGQIAFGLNFGQGSNQTSVTQTPSVTLMNGQQAFVSDTSQTPFVVSVVPVVGGFPIAPQQFQPNPGVDPNPLDVRVQQMLQARADAQAQAAAAQPQKPNNAAPQGNKKAEVVPDPPTPAEAATQRLNAAQESTAGRPAPSVAEAKRLHQQEVAAGDGEMAALMVRARALEEDGQPNVAKIYYQRIAKHATGELKQQATTRLYELQRTVKP